METVRIGIIGIGNMGSAHATSIFAGRIKGLTLAAVCDIDPDKRQWAAEHLPGMPFFSQYADLIQSGLADAILIATPHYLHPEIAIAGFAQGLHVLTEKPAGVFAGQVYRMNEAARQSGKVFGIMFNQRTNPLYQKAREMVQTGVLGQPKRLLWVITNWYRTQGYYNSGTWRATWAGEGGGVLLNQAPHNLDLWQWIFGMPQRIRAFCGYGRYHDVEVEDDVTIYAEYDSGAVATFITTTGECPGTNRLEISGDRGKLVIEEGVLRFWELSIPERVYCYDLEGTCGEPQITVSEYVPTEPETGHNGILQNFTNAILHGEPLLAPGYEGLNSLEISNAAYLSDWTGQTITLPADPDEFVSLLQQRIQQSRVQPRPKGRSGQVRLGEYSDRWRVKW